MGGESGYLRRALAMVSAVVLLTLGGLVIGSPARACACGGVVAGDGEDVEVSHEAAAVAWDGSNEDIVLQMDMAATTDEAALIIPTPTKPTVHLAQPDFFDDLRAMAEPRTEVDYTWWPSSDAATGHGEALDDGAEEDSSMSARGSAVASSSVRLDSLETEIFAAGDVDELTDWLRAGHYVMSDQMAAAMTPYVSEGWYFVALRLQSTRGTLTGQLQPIRLSFESNSLIYPMRMSTAARTDQDVTTYVIADTQVRRTDPTATSTPATLQFAGPIDTALKRSGTWAELRGGGDYLTVINQHFWDPAQQILSDFTFAAAPGAADYQQVVHVTRMREILGLPAGPVLIALFLLLIGAPLGYALRRRPGRRDAVVPVREHRRSSEASSFGH